MVEIEKQREWKNRNDLFSRQESKTERKEKKQKVYESVGIIHKGQESSAEDADPYSSGHLLDPRG